VMIGNCLLVVETGGLVPAVAVLLTESPFSKSAVKDKAKDHFPSRVRRPAPTYLHIRCGIG
jgi:hypothetical protein